MLARLIVFIFFTIPLDTNAQMEHLLRSQADSLRLCGFYEEEAKIREQMGIDDFDKQLVSAHILLASEKALEAKLILEKLSPEQPEQHFWTQRALALVYKIEKQTEKSLTILDAISTPSNALLHAILLIDRAQLFDQQNDYSQVITLLQQAIQLLDDSPYRHHYKKGLALSDLAYTYNEVGMRHNMLIYSDRALRLILNYYPRHYAMISTLHNNFLYYVLEYGDAKQAADLTQSYEKYMNHFLKHKSQYMILSEYSDVHAEALFRLSKIRYYSFKENADKVVESTFALEDFFKTAPLEWKKNNWAIMSAGYELVPYTFRQLKDFTKAIKYAAYIDKAEQRPYNLMKKHATYALTYYDAQSNELAYQHVNACLNAFQFSKGSKSLQTLLVLKAELLSRLGKWQEAESLLKSLYEEILQVTNIDYYKIQIDQYPQHLNKVFLNVLIHSGWIYQNLYWQRGKQQEDYQLARQFFLLAAQTFTLYYKKDLNNKSLAELISEIEDGLYFQLHLLTPKEIKQHLSLIEQFKDAHLWQKFTSNYIENLNLPKPALERKNELQLQRNLLSRTFEQEIKFQAKIDSIDQQLLLVEKSINKSNPEFAHFSNNSIQVEALQKQLTSSQAIIRYSYGKDYVYAHVITHEQIQALQLTSKEELQGLVNEYMDRLKSIRQDYAQLRSHLQKILISPLELSSCDRIQIISEGFLTQIPFETLFDAPKTISYNYNLKSAQFLATKTASITQENLVGFVPYYTSPDNLTLHFTTKELRAIQELIPKSELFVGDQATKSNFLNSLGKSTMHHLAMHSEVNFDDYEQSSLVFQNQEKVYFHELYSLNFPSQLVVLGACNTATGQYLDGEGVMSLARALHYAGASSSITSLWPVPDKESADLMSLFYQEIAQGVAKDEALMNAKSRFQELYPLKSHPYYWAGYILTGNTEALEMHQSTTRYFFLGALLLLIGTTLYLQRGNKTSLWKRLQ